MATAVTVLPEEIREWKQHPCTLAFLSDLQARVEEGKANWAAGVFQRPENAVETAMANAEAMGGMTVLKAMIRFLEGEEG